MSGTSPKVTDTVIDLRSDTVTKPCPAMRRAIAEAEVGDDVYGEDPTVNRLQERAAQLLGMEAALFVPSGSMANQIAIKAHTQPGDEVLVGQNAHNWLFESGAAPVISGVQVTRLPGDGRFDAAALESAIKGGDPHLPPTRMVSIENTHNMAGGLPWDRQTLAEVLEVARARGLATHLDGARLWNAAVAAGVAESELTRGFDTVSVCLSKGLGAPIGSLLVGSRDLIRRAHRFRKMLGGGMRQAGFLAAAGLYALDHNRARMADDHHNAGFLAQEIAKLAGATVDLDAVETNIVMIDLDPGEAAVDGKQLSSAARQHGVLFNPISSHRVRLVTHLDVDRAACARAVEVIAEVLSAPARASA